MCGQILGLELVETCRGECVAVIPVVLVKIDSLIDLGVKCGCRFMVSRHEDVATGLASHCHAVWRLK